MVTRDDRAQRRQAHPQGFTLIELIVVVVILGILSGIAVVSVRGYLAQGTRTACSTDYQSVAAAIQAYRNDHDAEPSSLNELVSGSDPYLATYPEAAAGAKPPFYLGGVIYGSGYQISLGQVQEGSVTVAKPLVSIQNPDSTYGAPSSSSGTCQTIGLTQP